MKAFFVVLAILFAIFMTLYISQATGYYDYEQYKKVSITKDKISQFEQDVRDGKEIRVENYLDNVQIDYNNKVSKTGLKLSSTIKKYVKSSINGTLEFFGMLLGE